MQLMANLLPPSIDVSLRYHSDIDVSRVGKIVIDILDHIYNVYIGF